MPGQNPETIDDRCIKKGERNQLPIAKHDLRGLVSHAAPNADSVAIRINASATNLDVRSRLIARAADSKRKTIFVGSGNSRCGAKRISDSRNSTWRVIEAMPARSEGRLTNS